MELANVGTEDRAEARAKYLEYRAAVRAGGTVEDEAIMRGYREVAKGNTVISLTAALRAGGRFAETGYPRLAVCRADAERVWLAECNINGAVQFVTKRSRDGRASRNKVDVRAFGSGTLPTVTSATFADDHDARRGDMLGWQGREKLYTIVPTVPPNLRPFVALSNYDILFEVEAWSVDPVPPVDPALLKHIGGDLYAVMAVWDLTELERTVLAGRSRR